MTDKIREALARLVEAVQFTPLGIRGIKAVEAAHVALAQQPDTVAVPREDLERVLSGEECAASADKLRRLLAGGGE